MLDLCGSIGGGLHAGQIWDKLTCRNCQRQFNNYRTLAHHTRHGCRACGMKRQREYPFITNNGDLQPRGHPEDIDGTLDQTGVARLNVFNSFP